MKVAATAHCLDGLVRQFGSYKSIVEYDNPQRAAVNRLAISAQSRDLEATAAVSLGTAYSAPISLSLQGEEATILAMRTALTDIIAGMKPWYSRVAIGMPIFFVFYALGQIMVPSSNTPRAGVPFAQALKIVIVVIGAIGLIAILCWGIAILRKRFFPVATFAIGQGLARHQHKEQIRWVVIVGFFISVLASIVATILFAITSE